MNVIGDFLQVLQMGANQRVPQGQEIAMVHILDLNKRERTVLDTHIHKRMNVQKTFA